jgi:serine/threonine-protein kinase HipA
MVKTPSAPLQVKYCRTTEPLLVGRLALVNKQFIFEYAADFLKSGIELSPFKLPLKAGVQICEERVFDGLFGIFNDSLPDGWGRLLLDRKLMGLGINLQALTPLDRLKYVGTRGMGALHYEPEFALERQDDKKIELDQIAEECFQFQVYEQDQFVDDLLDLNGSSAGARPKILVSIHQETDQLQASDNALSHAHPDWIVKFRSSTDPQDVGPIEYAYHLMAKEAGLMVPDSRLFKSRRGPGYFGVKRFDRSGNRFLHMHTLSGLLHADHRLPCLDYEAVMKATQLLTKNASECEKQFRNAAFNVYSCNRDDHSKNFSFLMDETGTWSVSPAYDLTFSAGPGGEHCTTLMGNGRNPGRPELLKLASVVKMPEKRALVIIDQVKSAISQWTRLAQIAGVSPLSTRTIETQLRQTLTL